MLRILEIIAVLTLCISYCNAEELDALTGDNDNDYVVVPGYDLPDYESDEQFKVYEKVNVKEFSLPSCNEVPIYFDSCRPSACESVDPFGKVLRRLDGLDKDGNCRYVERTKGFGGIDCVFPKDSLEQVNKYYQGFFFATASDGVKLSTAEIEYFKDLKNKSCQAVADTSITNTVILDKDGNALNSNYDAAFSEFAKPVEIVDNLSEQGTENNQSANINLKANSSDLNPGATRDQITNATTLPQVPLGDNSKDGKKEEASDIFSIFDIKSIMFTQSEIDELNSILSGGLGTDEAEKVTQVKTSRSYYLKSIMYLNTKKWAIWVNNLKITSDALGGGLKVDVINNRHVLLTWNTPLSSLDRISPTWRDKLITVSAQRYVSEDNLIFIEIPDDTSANIKFKLSPNQTFDASNMLIKEGNIG